MIEEAGLPPELKQRVLAAVRGLPSSSRRETRLRSALRLLLLVAFSGASQLREPGPSPLSEATLWNRGLAAVAPPPAKPLDVSSVGWFDKPP
jgi:hypothetical protein